MTSYRNQRWRTKEDATPKGWVYGGPADLAPGEIVIAAVYNRVQDPKSLGKERPCVFVSRNEGSAWLLPLTSHQFYANGNPRIPLVNPFGLGLLRRGYLWTPSLIKSSIMDIFDHVGYVHRAAIQQIAELGLLNYEEFDQFMDASNSGSGHLKGVFA